MTRTSESAATAEKVSGHGGLLAAHALRQAGVGTLFTLSGGHLFPLYDGCVKLELPIVDVRHEQSAVFAAEGLAKVSRRPGVAALTAGPGVTNGVSAMTTAFFTGSPVLVLGGRAPESRWGKGSLQELDHVPVVESVTKLAFTSRVTSEIPADLARALAAATTAHRGPAFVDFPLDVIFGPGESEIEAVATPQTQVPSPEDVDAIAALLRESERPVLMVGADAYWEGGEEAVRTLAEECGLPVFMNGLGRGILPADHANAFARARSAGFRQGDLVIVVGTPLDFRLGFGDFGDAKVVHVMDRPERLATGVELAASAAGDLPTVLDEVRAATGGVDRSEWLAILRGEEQQRREKDAAMLTSDADPIHPGRLYGELIGRLDRDAIVIGDGGDFVSYAGKLVDTFTPGCFLDPGPYGCLGTGPGYAIGAASAHPDRQIVLLLGDGAAGFSLAELDTLARFDLPVVVVVGNNLCWGLEKHPMQQLFGYHVAAELAPSAHYHRVAESLGVPARRVEKPKQIGEALDWAFDHSGPTLIEVMTDPEDMYPRSANLA